MKTPITGSAEPDQSTGRGACASRVHAQRPWTWREGHAPTPATVRPPAVLSLGKRGGPHTKEHDLSTFMWRPSGWRERDGVGDTRGWGGAIPLPPGKHLPWGPSLPSALWATVACAGQAAG